MGSLNDFDFDWMLENELHERKLTKHERVERLRAMREKINDKIRQILTKEPNGL